MLSQKRWCCIYPDIKKAKGAQGVLNPDGTRVPLSQHRSIITGMNQNNAITTIDKPLTRLLSKFPEIRLAILFGSQAAGKATNDSDIDLALLADTPLSANMKLQLMEEIGLEFGRPVDIVDMYHAPEPILGQVFKGKKLLGDNSTYAALLSRHLLNTADFLPLQQRILAERRAAWIN